MNRFSVILLLSAASVIVLTIGIKMSTKQSRAEACTYTLPKGFTLAQDTLTKEYVIQTKEAGTTHYSIDEPRYMSKDFVLAEDYYDLLDYYFNCDRFSDSCSAKKMVKEYQESRSVNRIKKVN